MKKFTITTLLLAIFICSQAQEASDESKTSKFVLGGNFAFEYSSSKFELNNNGLPENEKANSALISFMPYAGVKISKKITVGLKLGYTHYNDYCKETRIIVGYDDWGDQDYTMRCVKGNEYTLSPFIRYTNTIKQSKLNYFFELSTGISMSSGMEAEIGDYDYLPYKDYEFTKYFVAGDVGLLYQLTNKLGLEFNLAFFNLALLNEEFDNEVTYKTMDIKLMPELFRPNIGINLNF